MTGYKNGEADRLQPVGHHHNNVSHHIADSRPDTVPTSRNSQQMSADSPSPPVATLPVTTDFEAVSLDDAWKTSAAVPPLTTDFAAVSLDDEWKTTTAGSRSEPPVTTDFGAVSLDDAWKTSTPGGGRSTNGEQLNHFSD